MKRIASFLLPLVICGVFAACEEADEAMDRNNDIIVRNGTNQFLYIMIDGVARGQIENNGAARTMWDGIDDGKHDLEAYVDDQYTELFCDVGTGSLNNGEDFRWYLDEPQAGVGSYTGTKEGACL